MSKVCHVIFVVVQLRYGRSVAVLRSVDTVLLAPAHTCARHHKPVQRHLEHFSMRWLRVCLLAVGYGPPEPAVRWRGALAHQPRGFSHDLALHRDMKTFSNCFFA